jgi:hypothetical protein
MVTTEKHFFILVSTIHGVLFKLVVRAHHLLEEKYDHNMIQVLGFFLLWLQAATGNQTSLLLRFYQELILNVFLASMECYLNL